MINYTKTLTNTHLNIFDEQGPKLEANIQRIPPLVITSPPGSALSLFFVPAGLIEQRVTDGPRGCCPISGLPRAQRVSPVCYWLRRVWERMQRGFHTNWEHASRL
ncbi:hypothetical protein ILYODFUR_001111 [Ilyodon furcidens]|uniref:Uncharacterized protein n=1 Tax=Ilyodon furcidens TaxID=33524 RepID=A0ABV0UZ69_9TELE